MRIVGITDLHGNYQKINKILVHKPDVLVISGDITHFGKDLRVIDYLKYLKKNSNIKIFAIPGNCDSEEVINEINGMGINLDGWIINIEGVYFIGLGGSNITPFNTPNEYTEEEIYLKFKNTVKKVKKEDLINKFVLISHTPPYNTMADRVNNNNVGSTSIRRIIEEYSPSLVVCGHIHESRCIDKIGNSYIVNPSPRSFFISDIFIEKYGDKKENREVAVVTVKALELIDY